MALDYVETSKKIVEAVGGAGNISSATNCMTRLRLVLKDEGKAKDDAVQAVKGVKGVMRQADSIKLLSGMRFPTFLRSSGNWGIGMRVAHPLRWRGTLSRDCSASLLAV